MQIIFRNSVASSEKAMRPLRNTSLLMTMEKQITVSSENCRMHETTLSGIN
jgi:hypothetical protein